MPDEPETYDLAFDPDEEPEDQPAAAPPRRPKPLDDEIAKSDAGPTRDDDRDTIPLDLPDEPEIRDPRAGNTASRPPARPSSPDGSGSSARRPTDLDAARDADDSPPSEEPAAVSPAKARAAREEQRIRAAQEQAEADARKQKLIFILVGSVVGLLVLLWLLSKIF